MMTRRQRIQEFIAYDDTIRLLMWHIEGREFGHDL